MHHAYLLQYQQAGELLEEAKRFLENSMAMMENAHAQITVAWLLQNRGQIKKSIMILEKTFVILQDGGDVWGYVCSGPIKLDTF
jgi:tetratricopeptide (TPR) repeat protein